MNLDRYQQAWKSESSQVAASFDPASLSKEVSRAHRRFRWTLFWRDVREIGLSLIAIPVWIALGVALSLPWTWYLTVVAMLWVAGFLLVDRMRHPRHASGPGEPLLIDAHKSLAQVEHQIWLLRNVCWWYLLPFAISIMTFFIHVTWMLCDSWWEFALFTVVLGLFLWCVYWATYRVNQRAVRMQLVPRRNNLQELILNLEDESDAGGDERMDLVSLLSGSDENADLSLAWAMWSENWNRIIPSWREVALILVPTLVGAFCGLRYPLSGAGPVFFQTVVAAVIPFEIVFFSLWFLASRRHQSQPLTGEGAARPGAPAIVTLALILVISLLAFSAIFAFLVEARSARGPGLENVSEFTDGDSKHADEWLQGIVDSFYPSLSTVVVREGEVVYHSSIGYANVEANRSATSTTPYHVASVTKVFTASLAAVLHEQGTVDLDQPVVEYLPDNVRISTTPELGATITLRQLASHTSGLPRGVPGQVQSVEGRYDLEPQRLYDQLASVVLVADPGTTTEYSNLGFGLLGHVLERAANTPLDRLLQELICDPLKLANTAIQDDEKIHPATGYYRQGRGGGEVAHSLKERLAGSGGLVTSLDDLARFLIAQMKPGAFTSGVLENLHTETLLADGSGSGNGLGWSVRMLDEVGPILEKNGGRLNCSAWIGFSPQHKVAVAVVTNCGGPDVSPIGRRLLAQSIPADSKTLPARIEYARVSPFTSVSFEGEQVIVTWDGEDYQWLEMDGIKVEDIVASSKRRFGTRWQRRVAEDIVEVLVSLGHQPEETVELRLRDLQTEQEVLVESAPMTEANRSAIYRSRTQENGQAAP